MKQDSEWEVLPPVSAPRVAAPQSEWEALPPVAPRRSAAGRQPAPARAAPVVRDEGEYSGALTREDSVRAFMDQGYPADVALQKAIEQEQYDDAMTAAAAGGQRADPASGAITVEELPPEAVAPQGNLLDQAAAGARRNPVLGTLMGLGVGAAAGVNDMFGGAVRLAGNAMSYVPGLGDFGRGVSQNANEFLAATNQRVDAERDNAGLGGAVETARLAGQVAAPIPGVGAAGNVIARGGRALEAAVPQAARVARSVARIGEALPAGGMAARAAPAAGAPARTAAERLGYLAENAAAGAAAGAIATAPLADQDATTGAVLGALLPIAARPAMAAVGVVTNLWQKAVGAYGEANAARIVRQALGVDYEVALAALRNAPEGVTAQQALADAGVPADVFMAVGEAGRAADPRPYRVIADAQEAARQGRLAPAQGAVQAAEVSGAAALNDAQGAVQAAETAGDAAAARAQQQQFRTAQAGEQLVGDAQAAQRAIPREGAAALEDLRVGAGEASDFYAASRAQAQRAIDDMAGGPNLTAARTSEAAAKQALRAATAPMRAELLAAADASGALTVEPISARLMQMADAPGVGTTNARVLARVASELDAMAARRGGVPSAEDVYAFRKDDLDDIITRALSTGRGGEVTSQAARRGELVRSTQDMLDSAIEAAGGTGWRDYLANYASGMRAVERQQMMGVAGRQLRQSPNEFVNLVGGESPGTVEGVFGPGRIDLANLMNPTGVGPSPMEALTRASGEIQRDARVRTLAQEGGGAARELLQQSAGGGRVRGMATLVGRVLRPGTAAAMDVGSALLDAKIAPQVRRELAQAYQSGANMVELLAMTPLADRAQVQRNLMNPAFWAHLQGGAVNAMTGNGEQANTMSPPPQ